MRRTYALNSLDEQQHWNGDTWNPMYVEVNDWYTIKYIKGNVQATYIHGVYHDNVWVSDY